MGKALQGYLADFLDDNPAPELYKTQRQIDRIHEIHHNDVFDVEIYIRLNVQSHYWMIGNQA